MYPLLPPDQQKKLWPQGEAKPLTGLTKRIVEAELKEFDISNPEAPTQTKTKTNLPNVGCDGPLMWVEDTLREVWGERIHKLSRLAAPPSRPPTEHVLNGGWMRYGDTTSSVPYPLEDVFLFDTETVVRQGNHPCMAVAYSGEAWYLWLHPALIDPQAPWDGMLIPLGPDKVFVAHNAMFDQSKTLEAYNFHNSDRNYAWCTMATHNAMGGLGGEQVLRAAKAIPPGANLPWQSVTSSSSLASCLTLYTGRVMNKDARELFVKGTLDEIRGSLSSLVEYCFQDVVELGWLHFGQWAKWRKHCPSIITTVGLLELSKSYLPLAPDYWDKVENNSATAMVMVNELETSLGNLARGLKEDPLDPWARQLDWTPAKTGKNKGVPLWYRKAKGKFTPKGNLAPILLRVSYLGNPVAYHPTQKWGYIDDKGFHKIPNPKGDPTVGCIFAKEFIKQWEKGSLVSHGMPGLAETLASVSYWGAFESRFRDQYTPPKTHGIVPTTSLLGTLTGRQVERLWLTAAQAKPGKLGTDMMHSIQSPPGYSFVAWDEDTEEVRIAAVWGDYYRGFGLGSTPLSHMAMLGNKEDGTDQHTITAKYAAISRQEAKVANFRDIFGGGEKTQAMALKSSHPDWENSRVESTVKNFMLVKRGRKNRGVWVGGTDSAYHNQANAIANTKDFRLPMTRRKVPHVINPRYDVKGQFFTSRYNFPVQGTGSDILHLTAALTPILAREAGVEGLGYVMARHDEIAYTCPDEYTTALAEIGHTAHTVAWACFLDSLGFDNMPINLCRLGSVNIDKVYRKEVDAPTDAGFGLGWEFPNGVSYP